MASLPPKCLKCVIAYGLWRQLNAKLLQEENYESEPPPEFLRLFLIDHSVSLASSSSLGRTEKGEEDGLLPGPHTLL